MEVRGANIALTNRASAAIDGFGSEEKAKQQAKKAEAAAAIEESEFEDQPVLLSISAAGMRRSQLLEKQAAGEGSVAFSGEVELEMMLKKMEGLSSQVINGYFSTSDRLKFSSEISMLSNELNRLNGDGVVVSKEDCSRMSQRIMDLTRVISDAAVYRNSARTVFMVNSRQPEKAVHTKLDIAI